MLQQETVDQLAAHLITGDFAEWIAARPTGTTSFWDDLELIPETGEGYQTDSEFVVAVPFSGGMDSTTCFAMAEEVGYPVAPVYVDTGVSYSPVEYLAAKNLRNDVVYLSTGPLNYEEFGHIQYGRNLIILLTVARSMRSWGEIWFGNQAGVTESPIVGGDKSNRFFLSAQQILTGLEMDVRVVNPLATMTKPDIVQWWLDRGRLDELLQTRSCFSNTEGHCGDCPDCLRRWVAFEAHSLGDLVIDENFDGRHNLAPHAETLVAQINNNNDITHRGRRADEALSILQFALGANA